MRFLCIHRGGQRNRLWGLFNSQRVGDCTLSSVECSQPSASFRFLLSYASRYIYKYSPAPISGGSRDLVPYNRSTGLRHSGLSCLWVGNHTLTLVFLTQAELMQRVSHAIDMPVVPTLYQLCRLQAVVFSCDQWVYKKKKKKKICWVCVACLAFRLDRQHTPSI